MRYKKILLSALSVITAFSLVIPTCAAGSILTLNENTSSSQESVLVSESSESFESGDSESTDVPEETASSVSETDESVPETEPSLPSNTLTETGKPESETEESTAEETEEDPSVSTGPSIGEAYGTEDIQTSSFSADLGAAWTEAEQIYEKVLQNMPQTYALSDDQTAYLQLQMLIYLNIIRAQNGIEPLALYDPLNAAAVTRAQECVTLFSHTRPNGTDCFTILDEYGILWGTVGENIAWGYPDVFSVLQEWWNSPGHQANMVDSSFQLLGPGVVENNGTYYWTQLFTGGYTMTQMDLYGVQDYYEVGTSLQDTGLLLVVTYSNGIKAYLPVLDSMISGYNPNVEGEQTVQVNCQGYCMDWTLTVRDSVKAFVSRLYTEILGRNPDASGLTAWTNVLRNGTEQGAKVAQGFIDSTEFKKRQLSDDEYITILYHTFLDREPDSSGLNAWKAVLESGLSRLHVFKGFAESVEFTEICKSYGIIRGNAVLTAPMDQNEGVTKFVVRCYRLCLGREADSDGLNAWCNQILTGQNTAKEAAHGFVFSDEFKKKNLSDEDYIRTLYRVFMDREADGDGLNAWLRVLRNGQSREHVFNGFADSNEFREICAEYGIK